MYRFVAGLFGLASDLFYRRRMLGGALPEHGPLVIVANHLNGLIDPVVIMRISDRPVRFLAKAPIFGMPLIGRLAKWVRALPVYRAQDGHDTSSNQDMFRAVYASLADGDCICLFPEGISHSEPGLQPLKTGAARMALGAEAAADAALGVQVVPVGLNYRDKAIFRSEVAVRIGEPITIDAAWRAQHAEDPRAAARALTDAIERAIRQVTVNLDAWDDLPVLELAARIWVDEQDPVERLRTMADAQRTFLETAPQRIADLRNRLLAFGEDLDALGLTPEALDHAVGRARRAAYVLRNLVAVTLGLPFALLGAVAYFAPYQLIKLIVRLARPEEDIVATVKVLGSVLFFIPWHLALVALTVAHSGPWAGVCASVVLPLSALYTHHFIERRLAALRRARMALTLLSGTGRALADALKAERDDIRAEIDALAAEYT